ncbi:MAG: hypothetical protein O3A80_05155 [bacterium]|nr:hypothetical protein [bacterium]
MKSHRLNYASTAFLVILLTIAMLQLGVIVINEWMFTIYGTGDSAIFLAMGRAILNGFTPYIDVFETKPPGIFLIAAASLAINNDVTFSKILHVAALVCIPIIIAKTTSILLGKEKQNIQIYGTALAVIFGVLISMFVKTNTGAMHTELIGALFGILYAASVVTMHSNSNPSKKRMLLMGILAMLCVLIKEQFILSIIAVALINDLDSPKRTIYTLVLPLLFGGLFGMATLWTLNMLTPYVSVYLPYMVFEHSNLVSARSNILPLPLRGFLWGTYVRGLLTPTLFAVPIITLWVATFCKASMRGYRSVLVMFIALWLTVLGAEIADQNAHQQVVAAPVYAIMFWCATVFLVKEGSSKAKSVYASIMAAVMIPPLMLTNITIDPMLHSKIVEKDSTVRMIAKEVDRILDDCHYNRYVLLSVTDQFYAYTEHTPFSMGLMQHIYRQNIGLPTFRPMMRRSMEQTNVVLIRYGDFLAEQVALYLKNYFSLSPPPCAGKINLPDHLTIMFRVKPHGNTTQVPNLSDEF